MPTGLWLYAYFVFFAIVIVESLLMIAVLRQVTTLHTHFVKNDPNAGLPLGALAPVLSGDDLFGRPVSLSAARGKKTLLIFVSAGCSYCRPVMSVVPAILPSADFELILVVSSSKLRTRLFLEEHWLEASTPAFPILADERTRLGERFRVSGVPHAVVVDEDGRIGAQGQPTSASAVALLLEQTDVLRKRRWDSGNAGEPASRLMAVASTLESARDAH